MLVETTQSVFEIRVVGTDRVEVTGTDRRFHKPIVGRFKQSVYDPEASVALLGWIGKDLRMDFVFLDAIFRTTPAVSASVIGEGWKYDVF